jgi:flagellar hook-associated protein 1
MSLFGAIQGSANALSVNQLGLQVVSNNIANAGTPGYVRQELIQAPSGGVRVGGSIIGQGVEVVGVQQKVDNFVLKQLRDVQGKLSQSQTLQEANGQLETSLSAFSDTDFANALSTFSNALQDVANQPGDPALRSLAIQRGVQLANGLNGLASQVQEIAGTANSQITEVTKDVNRLTSSIAAINKRIVELEGGKLTNSDAGALRDERNKALDALSSLVSIDAFEQQSGAVTVFVGGDYLVADGLYREVKTVNVDGSLGGAQEVRLADTDTPLGVTGGKLKGLYDSRDGASGKFLQGLNSVARNVISEVNRVHSQGQGASGFREVIGDAVISDVTKSLELSGDNLDIENGVFTISISDSQSGESKSFDIQVRQNGQSSDTTVVDLVSQLNAVGGIQASVSNDGRLQIRSASQGIKFSFSKDTSGVLSSLGINTFFTGDSAQNIAVRSDILKNPTLLAISLDGPGQGNANALRLAEALSKPSSKLNGVSVADSYKSLVTETSQSINSQQSISDGLNNFYQTLNAKHLGLTGVSLDEEGIKMLLYQRAFQASSRVISIANEMLNTLMQIV